jgi:hypothetical protein
VRDDQLEGDLRGWLAFEVSARLVERRGRHAVSPAARAMSMAFSPHVWALPSRS